MRQHIFWNYVLPKMLPFSCSWGIYQKELHKNKQLKYKMKK